MSGGHFSLNASEQQDQVWDDPAVNGFVFGVRARQTVQKQHEELRQQGFHIPDADEVLQLQQIDQKQAVFEHDCPMPAPNGVVDPLLLGGYKDNHGHDQGHGLQQRQDQALSGYQSQGQDQVFNGYQEQDLNSYQDEDFGDHQEDTPYPQEKEEFDQGLPPGVELPDNGNVIPGLDDAMMARLGPVKGHLLRPPPVASERVFKNTAPDPLFIDEKFTAPSFRHDMIPELSHVDRVQLEELGDIDMLCFPNVDCNPFKLQDDALPVYGPNLGYNTYGYLDKDGILLPSDHWLTNRFELWRIPASVSDADVIHMLFRKPHTVKNAPNDPSPLLPYVPRHLWMIPPNHDITQDKMAGQRTAKKFEGEKRLVAEYYKQAILEGRRQKKLGSKQRWLTSAELAANQFRIIFANLTMGKISRALARALFNEICLDTLSHQNNNQYPQNRFACEIGQELCRELYFWGKWVLCHGNWKGHLKPLEECTDEDFLQRDVDTYLYSTSKERWFRATIKLCSWQSRTDKIAQYGIQYIWTEAELVEKQVMDRFMTRAKLRGIIRPEDGDTKKLWCKTKPDADGNFLYDDGMLIEEMEYDLPQDHLDAVAKEREKAKNYVHVPRKNKRKQPDPELSPVDLTQGNEDSDESSTEGEAGPASPSGKKAGGSSSDGRSAKRRKGTDEAGSTASHDVESDNGKELDEEEEERPSTFAQRIKDLKKLPPFHHLNEKGQPVDEHGNPARPSCMLWKAPVPEDPRWNIWTIGHAIPDGNVSNHRFGLKLGHYKAIIEKAGIELDVNPKKATVADLVIALHKHRRLLMAEGQHPAGWHPKISWWYMLKENGDIPDWLQKVADRNGRAREYRCLPCGDSVFITDEEMEEMCRVPEKQKRRDLRSKSSLFQQEFVNAPSSKGTIQKWAGGKRKGRS